MTDFTPEIQTALAAEFDDSEIGWKPQVTTKGKNKEPIMRNGIQVAGCTAHIDARAVMNRLDTVVGVGGWSDSYTILTPKNVECTLTVFGVSKADVGETNDGGFADAMKSAYSDALKRAAVKFGIGRYLYDMEMEWLPYDGYKITSLPAPKKQTPPKPAPVNRQPVPPPVPPMKASWEDIGNGNEVLTPVTLDTAKWELFRGKVSNNPRSTVGSVSSAAAAVGAYRSEQHALNAAKQWRDGLWMETDKPDKSIPLHKDEALELYDWLISRKQADQTPLFPDDKTAGYAE